MKKSRFDFLYDAKEYLFNPFDTGPFCVYYLGAHQKGHFGEEI